jgi:hypothetical protein
MPEEKNCFKNFIPTENEVGLIVPFEILEIVRDGELSDTQVGSLMRSLLGEKVEVKGLPQVIVKSLKMTFDGANSRRNSSIAKTRMRRASLDRKESDEEQKANCHASKQDLLRVKGNSVSRDRIGKDRIGIYTPISPDGDEKNFSDPSGPDEQDDSPSPPSEEELSSTFKAIAEMHPRKENIKAAERAFRSLCLKKSPREILSLHGEWCSRWRKSGKSDCFAPQLAKWLRGERWRDEIIPDREEPPPRADAGQLDFNERPSVDNLC